jgi:hypothetical protein
MGNVRAVNKKSKSSQNQNQTWQVEKKTCQVKVTTKIGF